MKVFPTFILFLPYSTSYWLSFYILLLLRPSPHHHPTPLLFFLLSLFYFVRSFVRFCIRSHSQGLLGGWMGLGMVVGWMAVRLACWMKCTNVGSGLGRRRNEGGAGSSSGLLLCCWIFVSFLVWVWYCCVSVLICWMFSYQNILFRFASCKKKSKSRNFSTFIFVFGQLIVFTKLLFLFLLKWAFTKPI